MNIDIFNESAIQKERFRNAANKLLNYCFLVKKKENTKKEYMFVLQNQEFFVPYFELLGYRLNINEEQGVIGIVNEFGTGRLQLNKYESIVLLILRLLYLEKRKDITTSTQEVIVLMEEVRERYNMLKIKAKPVLDKSIERSVISTFRKYSIVQNIESDVTVDNARVIIYPSVMMAVSNDDINDYYLKIQDKLSKYAGGRDDDSTEEDADESQTD